MFRREIREHLFRMLFRKEFHEEAQIQEQINFYFRSLGQIDEKDEKYLKERLNKVLEKLPEIDAILEEHSSGWKLSRMGKVDLTVMRIAVFEIKYDDEVPNKVAINEAVEIAKKYGEESSGSFVNGVLAKLIQ